MIRHTLQCGYCGQVFEPPRCSGSGQTYARRYCSPACRSAAQTGERNIRWNPNKYALRQCAKCGKDFRFYLAHLNSDLNSGKFCSRSCSAKVNFRGQGNGNWTPLAHILTTCKNCRGPFETRQSKLRAGRGQFCSRNCRAIYMIRRMPTKATTLERQIGQLIEMLGVIAVPQHPIKGIGVLDFFIPAENLAVECDGFYWHSRHLDRDNCRDAKLTRHGIKT